MFYFTGHKRCSGLNSTRFWKNCHGSHERRPCWKVIAALLVSLEPSEKEEALLDLIEKFREKDEEQLRKNPQKKYNAENDIEEARKSIRSICRIEKTKRLK